MTLADELRTAAAALRPSPDDKARLVLVTVPAPTADRFKPVGAALAALLEEHATFAALFEQIHQAERNATPAEREHTSEVRAALAVARLINGEQQ